MFVTAPSGQLRPLRNGIFERWIAAQSESVSSGALKIQRVAICRLRIAQQLLVLNLLLRRDIYSESACPKCALIRLQRHSCLGR
jgi:hypothetical protein